MGQEHSTALKKAFEKLDTDHNGQLNLRDILTIQDVGGVEHLVHNGPLLLFRFDKTGDGAINYSEFSKLLSYVKGKEKDLRARGHGLMRKKVWCPIDRATMNQSFEISRDASTPAITGQPPEELPPTVEEQEEVEGDVLAEEISRDAGEYFDQTVSSIEGRKKFLNWLFKMTDLDNNDKLTEEELDVLIKALRHDGISPEDLTYDPERLLRDAAKAGAGTDDQDHIFAHQLLSEYDTEGRGYLTPVEFSVLASLIIKNYELRNEYQEPPEQQIRLKGFGLKRRLGKGANGEVRLAVELKTGIRKAVKIVPKRDMAHLSSLDTEITAMMILRHEHIVRLDQVQEDDQYVLFVMELCGGGNISDYLDGKPIPETLARFYFQQIVAGVAYCHSKGVAHRDLKLDNILLDNTANIKITDFGHAGIYKSGWDVFQTPLVGGLCHLAPEQILGQPYSGEKHDVWSLGVILYVLLSGHAPFTSNHPQQLLDDIKNVKYTMPHSISRDAKQLIHAMLVADSNKRPSIAQIEEHPWLVCGDVDAPLLTHFSMPIPATFARRAATSCESVCAVLKVLGIEPVYNAATVTSDTEIKCHWPAKDVRFAFRVKETKSDGSCVIEFRLANGSSREFLSLMTKLKVTIAQKVRRLQKTANQPDYSNNPLLKASSANIGANGGGSSRSSPVLPDAPTVGETRTSDEIAAIENDGSLRPQIVSLAELLQLESEAAWSARESDANHHPEEDGKKKKNHVKEKNGMRDSTHLHAADGAGAGLAASGHRSRTSSHHHPKEVSPEDSGSDSETTSHRHHRGATKHHAPVASALPHGLLSGYHSLHSSNTEEIRRSRSVPYSSQPDDSSTVTTTTTSSHRTSDRHSSAQHHHHHEGGSKAARHSAHILDREDDDLELSTSSAHGGKGGHDKDHHHIKDKHRSSTHLTKEKVKEEMETSSTSKHRKYNFSVVSPNYTPGQILTQIPGLVSYGPVASEIIYKKTKKITSARSKSSAKSSSRKRSHQRRQSISSSSGSVSYSSDEDSVSSSISSSDGESSDESTHSRKSTASRHSASRTRHSHHSATKAARSGSPSGNHERKSRASSPTRERESRSRATKSHTFRSRANSPSRTTSSRHASPTRSRHASPTRSRHGSPTRSRHGSPTRSTSHSRQSSPTRGDRSHRDTKDKSSKNQDEERHIPQRPESPVQGGTSKSKLSLGSKSTADIPRESTTSAHSPKGHKDPTLRHSVHDLKDAANVVSKQDMKESKSERDVPHHHHSHHGQSHSSSQRSVPAAPMPTPSKASKSFKRSKETGIKHPGSVPIPPKHPKMHQSGSSESESESDGDFDEASAMRSSSHSGLLVVPGSGLHLSDSPVPKPEDGSSTSSGETSSTWTLPSSEESPRHTGSDLQSLGNESDSEEVKPKLKKNSAPIIKPSSNSHSSTTHSTHHASHTQEKADKHEKSEKSHDRHSDKLEASDKHGAEKLEKSEKSEKRADKLEKSEKSEKHDKHDKHNDNLERSDKHDKHSDKHGDGDKLERSSSKHSPSHSKENTAEHLSPHKDSHSHTHHAASPSSPHHKEKESVTSSHHHKEPTSSHHKDSPVSHLKDSHPSHAISPSQKETASHKESSIHKDSPSSHKDSHKESSSSHKETSHKDVSHKDHQDPHHSRDSSSSHKETHKESKKPSSSSLLAPATLHQRHSSGTSSSTHTTSKKPLKMSKSAHHSPEDSPSDPEEDIGSEDDEGAEASVATDSESHHGHQHSTTSTKKKGHKKHGSLGAIDPATATSTATPKNAKPLLPTAELSESEDTDDEAAAPAIHHSKSKRGSSTRSHSELPHVPAVDEVDRSQSLTSLSRKASTRTSTDHGPSAAPNGKRSRSFRKEKTATVAAASPDR